MERLERIKMDISLRIKDDGKKLKEKEIFLWDGINQDDKTWYVQENIFYKIKLCKTFHF